ncbi:MAG: FAD-dependent oxidoreductase [Clostridiales bacterium]|nr:FAD-dependent oxidoreductase [Clostridiales bacterium]
MEINYNKKVEVKYSADVLVIGGGPAGTAAAVCAAKQGVKVILIETHGALGGSGTVGMVPEFMFFDDGINLLSDGFGGEIKREFYGDKNEHKTYNVPVEALKRKYDQMVMDSGVKLLFFTRLVDFVVEGGVIKQAVVISQSGIYAIEAKTFVDCTGDGNASVRAGANSWYGDDGAHTNPATLCSMWGGVDFAKKNISVI